jgi:hypothetical protein
MHVKRHIVFLLAASLAGCWPWWSSDPGDDWCTCSYGDTTCGGYDLIGVCEDDCAYTYYDCTDVCADAGYARSAGCGWDSSSGQHACLCTDDVSCECSGGDADCWDLETLLTCDDGCWWSAWDCDALCRDSGWDASSGCAYDFETGEDACFCEDLTECDCSLGQVECSGTTSIASCDDGCSWTVYDCNALCMDEGYEYSTGCMYDASMGEDTCYCESHAECDCEWGQIECWDADSIASCDDGCWWSVYDCDELCTDSGWDYSTGCAYDWEAGEDTCFCESY